MIGANTTFFFESEKSRDWCAAALTIDAQTLTIDDFLQAICPLKRLSSEERLQIFERFLPAKQKENAAVIFRTVEKLRETFVLLPEHVEHCFLSLPKTPKNRMLRQFLEAYLSHADLALDRTAHAWKAIDMLKAGMVRNPFSPEVFFPRDPMTSPLVEELAQAFLNASGVECVNLDFPMEHTASGWGDAPRVFQGTSGELLLRLSESAARHLDEGARRVLIAFHGPDSDRAFLHLCLASHGMNALDLDDLDDAASNKTSLDEAPEKILTSIKQDSRQPLRKRLRLIHLCLENPRLRSIEPRWNAFWHELLNRGTLDESDLAFLLSLSTPEMGFKPRPSPSSNVIIGPLMIPPTTFPVLAYVTSPMAKSPRILFDECELASLYRQGFTVRGHRDARKDRAIQLARLAALATARLFADAETASEIQNARVSLLVAPPSPPRMPEKTPLEVGTSPLSPTALENFTKCPARYLFLNRMRLEDAKISRESGYARLFGTLVHATLENHFKQSKHYDGVEIHKLFRAAMTQHIPGVSLERPLAVRLLTHFEEIAPHIMETETTLQSLFTGASPTHLEWQFELSMDQVSVRGKIDRIDLLPEGSLLCLDYKTGSIDFTPAHITQGTHFQALIYLVAAQTLLKKSVAGFLFYDLKNGEIRRGLLREDLVSDEIKGHVTRGHTLKPERMNEILGAGLSHVKSIAWRIQQGELLPTPSEEACCTCPFPTHCRESIFHE
jgi:hypothetical protein